VHTPLMSVFFPLTMMVLVTSKKSWGMGTCKSSRGGCKNDRQDGGGDQPLGVPSGPDMHECEATIVVAPPLSEKK
jgi:hypothetical protein